MEAGQPGLYGRADVRYRPRSQKQRCRFRRRPKRALPDEKRRNLLGGHVLFPGLVPGELFRSRSPHKQQHRHRFTGNGRCRGPEHGRREDLGEGAPAAGRHGPSPRGLRLQADRLRAIVPQCRIWSIL